MEYPDVLKELIRTLEERFPGGYNYIAELADILNVHPKTIARKLRGETQFMLDEAIKIARKLDGWIDSRSSRRRLVWG